MIQNKILSALAVILIIVFFLFVGYMNSSNYKVPQKITPTDFENKPGYEAGQQMYLKYEAELGL